jgi:hypothetical protein
MNFIWEGGAGYVFRPHYILVLNLLLLPEIGSYKSGLQSVY